MMKIFQKFILPALLLIFMGSVPSLSYGKPKISQKMIIINARGANLLDINNFSDDKINYPFLNEISEKNMLRPLKGVENAVTAVNLASFDTGVPPAEHGIIGHTFGLENTAFQQGTSGFGVQFEHEAFWETVAKSGKQVLSIGALLTHGKYINHKNVDLYAQANKVTAAQLVDLKRTDFAQTISVNSNTVINLTHSQNILSVSYDIESTAIELTPNTWGKMAIPNHESTAVQYHWFKWIHNDSQSKLYIRDSFTPRANSAELTQKINDAVGQNPGWPNINLYMQEQIDKHSLIEEIEFEANHVMDVFSMASNLNTYDLILVDYPVLDRFGHAFVDAKTDKLAFSKAYSMFDRHMAVIKKYADNHGYELLIASGHGFSAVNSEINLNAYLKSKEYAIEKDWQVRAFPGKVSSHINLNPLLTQLQQTALIKQLTQDFKDLKHPQSNESVVAAIHQKETLSEIGLNHANAGDLFIQLKPGYLFQTQMFSERPIFDKPTVKGDHGYASKHPESRGMIYSSNTSIKHILQVANYVNKKLLCNNLSDIIDSPDG